MSQLLHSDSVADDLRQRRDFIKELLERQLANRQDKSGLQNRKLGSQPSAAKRYLLVGRHAVSSIEFLSGKTDADYSVATRLLVFDKAALGFVAKRFRSEADHLRVRGGVLVAPIDKIGLAPVFASIALTIWKLAKEFPIPYWVFMLLAGYSFWCFICVLGISHSQRYEELAQIIDLAVEMKNQSPEAYRASS